MRLSSWSSRRGVDGNAGPARQAGETGASHWTALLPRPRTQSATTYLDVNGRGPRTGPFDKFTTDAGLASGFISLEFDPAYVRHGRFYTIHLEEIALPGRVTPNNHSSVFI
jgi:hypothetical protein